MNKYKSKNGQSIVFIAIAFLGLVAVAALIIDGGSIYLNRRNAQTAADAAALAGAREKCINKGSLSSIQSVVNQYAVTLNHATSVDSVTIDSNGYVVVQTSITTPAFFSGVFGSQTDSVTATAAAGCFAPATISNLLPISWTCQPPVGGSTSACVIHSIPWSIFKNQIAPSYKNRLSNKGDLVLDNGDGVNYQTYTDGVGSKMAYIVADSNGFNLTTDCLPPIGTGTINCDFNGDGIPDVDGGANRGFLYFDGTGANDLKTIILNGFPGSINVPQWFPGTNGVQATVYDAASSISFNLVMVPVFNAICSNTNQTALPTDCPAVYQTGDLIKAGTGSQQNYYRVAGFAPFVITCVSKTSGKNNACPAKTYAGFTGKYANTSTIEGYFVSGDLGGTGIDPGGFDLGVYVISLTK
jgi:hypothetical protein